MSFWLDDDDNDDDPWSSQPSKAYQEQSASQLDESSNRPEQQQQQQVYISQGDSQQQQNQCTNCGSYESYYDDATGADVCTQCFTQSQVIASTQQTINNNETDWDDVMGLAARTTHGHFIQHKTPQQRRTGGEHRRRGRAAKPFDEYDHSVPLPDIHACLQGVRCVLQTSVTIIVTEILSKREMWNPIVEKRRNSSVKISSDNGKDDSDDDDDYYVFDQRQKEEYHDDTGGTQQQQQQLQSLRRTLLKSVKEIWMSYLQAWSSGAELYGKLYPYVRFSFRDLFLSNYHASYIVRRYIPHRIQAESKNQLKNNAFTTEPTPEVTESSQLHTTGNCSDNDGPNNDDDEFIDDPDDIDNTITGTYDAKTKQRRINKNTDIRCTAIQKIIRKHTAHGQKGYQEIALSVRPSMTMIASILYLAIAKHGISKMDVYTAGITYIDVCDWIKTGSLPLLTAYHRLLSDELQQRLSAIRGFFRSDRPISTSQLETMTTNLCVACRLRIHPKITNSYNNNGRVHSLYPAIVPSRSKLSDDDVRQWSMSNLPYSLARLVALTGFDQNVLDRSLQLIGLLTSNNNNMLSCDDEDTRKIRIPVVVLAEKLSRIDELLAIIAIACQLDPLWRDWMYMLPARTMNQNDVTPIIPWNESEVRSICNGPSFRHYLNYVNKYILPNNDDDDIKPTSNSSLLPLKYIDAMNEITNVSRTTEKDMECAIDQESNIVRPCRIFAGASAPDQMDVSNRIVKLPLDLISNYHKTRKQDREEPKANVVTMEQDSPTTAKKRKKDEKLQLRKQQKNTKQRFRRTECDEMHTLPNHDFYKADRCSNNDSIVTTGHEDIDQIRLIQYIGYTSSTSPNLIHRSMKALLQQSK